MASFAATWNSAREAGYPPPFLLLDAAGLEQGAAAIPRESFAEVECLFTGELAEELADVAPYLCRAGSWEGPVEATVQDLLERQLGVLAVLPPAAESLSFPQVHRHFRKLNVVHGSEGEPMFFRYYDPRVLPDVLQVLEPQQLAGLFGPVEALLLMPEPGRLVRCFRRGGALVMQTL